MGAYLGKCTQPKIWKVYNLWGLYLDWVYLRSVFGFSGLSGAIGFLWAICSSDLTWNYTILFTWTGKKASPVVKGHFFSPFPSWHICMRAHVVLCVLKKKICYSEGLQGNWERGQKELVFLMSLLKLVACLISNK